MPSLGGYVADQLNGPSRIASLSLGGWDTHHTQTKIMANQLTALSDMVLAMKAGLGTHWGTTARSGDDRIWPHRPRKRHHRHRSRHRRIDDCSRWRAEGQTGYGRLARACPTAICWPSAT